MHDELNCTLFLSCLIMSERQPKLFVASLSANYLPELFVGCLSDNYLPKLFVSSLSANYLPKLAVYFTIIYLWVCPSVCPAVTLALYS